MSGSVTFESSEPYAFFTTSGSRTGWWRRAAVWDGSGRCPSTGGRLWWMRVDGRVGRFELAGMRLAGRIAADEVVRRELGGRWRRAEAVRGADGRRVNARTAPRYEVGEDKRDPASTERQNPWAIIEPCCRRSRRRPPGEGVEGPIGGMAVASDQQCAPLRVSSGSSAWAASVWSIQAHS
jgi:hypothetical protein